MTDKGKEKLKTKLKQEIKSIQKQVLDYAELVISNKDQYQQFRRKVLGVTNDIRRSMELDLDLNYDIEYTPSTECEDVVIIGTKGLNNIDYKRKGKGRGKNGKGNY